MLREAIFFTLFLQVK